MNTIKSSNYKYLGKHLALASTSYHLSKTQVD